jgi:hypothetical protein
MNPMEVHRGLEMGMVKRKFYLGIKWLGDLTPIIESYSFIPYDLR